MPEGKLMHKMKGGIVGTILFPLFSLLLVGLATYFNINSIILWNSDSEYMILIIFFIFMFWVFALLLLFVAESFIIPGMIYALNMLKNPELAYKPAYRVCFILEIIFQVAVVANIVIFIVNLILHH